jgi:hypothetical protein
MKLTNFFISFATVAFFSYQAKAQMAANQFRHFPDSDWHLPKIEVKNTKSAKDIKDTKDSAAVFKPTFQVGALLQMVGVLRQREITAREAQNPDIRDWSKQLNIYRARILVGGNVSKKTSFFMETDIATPIGLTDANGNKVMQVNPIILDAQIEHTFSKKIGIIAGLQLVGTNRNALQGAASLMALDFGYYQYPYNLFETSPLQNNFGRDIGIHFRGFLFNERLEYRTGVFSGRNIDTGGTLRYITRLNYSFLDKEQDLYYTGTTLGKGQIFSIGGGADLQDRYQNFALDAFLDMPVGEIGSITANAAFNYINGGDNPSQKSLSRRIPSQTIQFLELGYYFKDLKLQPYFKFENQAINAANDVQTNFVNRDIFNTRKSQRRIGFGLNYFFSGYNANVKLLYESVSYGRDNLNQSSAETATRSEIWLQMQFFIF